MQRPEPKAVASTIEGQSWVDLTVKGFSLEEKVGQMLQVRAYVDSLDFNGVEYKHVRDELQKYGIGSVVLGMHFNRLNAVRASPQDAAKVTDQLQSDSKLPLLIAADLERGLASRLRDVPDFPWPMALGAIDDPAEAERFGAVTAREARAVGINWALAPIADVNSNPLNPVINDRSFGEDAERVGALVAAFVRGARQNGLLVTAKHFPGLGDSVTDSHRAVASIDADASHLQRIELLPFRRAIETGVDAVLLAHARVPALEDDAAKITTNSPKVVTGLLRGQLGYQGVILTDALEMRGITLLYDPQKGSPTAQATVDAVKAGCDVIMLPTEVDAPFHAIVEAVRSGQIPESRIDESVRRILKMKASVGLDKTRMVNVEQVATVTGSTEARDFAQHIADEAVTLVRDQAQLLPLQRMTPASADTVASAEAPKEGSLVAVVLSEGLESTNGREFEKALKSDLPDAQVFYADSRGSSRPVGEISEAISKAYRVIVAAYVTHRDARQVMVDGQPTLSFGLAGPTGQFLQHVLETASDKTVVVAFGSPYLIQSFPKIQTYVCTYAMASTSEISAIKALFGEIQNHAKLPVTLPGVAQRGDSLPWPTKPRPSP